MSDCKSVISISKRWTVVGFSLPELLVVMAIVSVMSGVLFVSVSKSTGKKEVENAAQQIATQIRALQNESLTGKLVDDGAGNMVSACRFILDTSPLTSYKVVYDKNCADPISQIGPDIIVDLTKKKVTVDSRTIIFLSPRGEVVGPTSNEIVVTSTRAGSVKKYVSLNSSGKVEIFDNTTIASCLLPWGGNILHGASVDANQSATVPCGSTCTAEKRTCNNGVLSGSFMNVTCSVSTCTAPCSLNGVPVLHGSSIDAFSATSVGCGLSCDSVKQSRTCNNGTLSGTFANNTCSPVACSSCNFNGTTVLHGGTVTAYSTSSVGCGSSCASETRTCTNGVLSGSFANSSCSATACASCTLGGTTVPHGGTIDAYSTSSVACGSTCNSVKQTRICSNGTLTGTYSNQSCSVQACEAPCAAPWGGSILHGQSVTAYQNSSAACGSSCVSESRTCNNGVLSGFYLNAGCFAQACSVWRLGSWNKTVKCELTDKGTGPSMFGQSCSPVGAGTGTLRSCSYEDGSNDEAWCSVGQYSCNSYSLICT